MAPAGDSQVQEPWDLSVQFLKGVGENLAKIFSKADIDSFWDLLLFLPRTYEDRRKVWTYDEIFKARQTGSWVSSVGKIVKMTRKGHRFKGKSWVEALVQAWNPSGEAQFINFVWFQDWGGSIEKRFPAGSRVFFRGKVQDFRGIPQFVHPDLQLLDKEIPWWEKSGWVPVYREVGGLSTKVIRRILAMAIDRREFFRIPEILPLAIVKKYNFPSLQESLRELHFPKKWNPREEDPQPEGIHYARLVFEELFHMALALHLRRARLKQVSKGEENKVPIIQRSELELQQTYEKLPFQLTQGQKSVLDEIFLDLSCTKGVIPMHRLLQGDVGSGKTIVAFIAGLSAMKNGYQVALMAPTEILANQHYINFCKIFPEHAHEIVLLKGALTAKQKKEARAKIKSGEVRFAIGTQALLTEDTEFQSLGLVIVDEQHRFGVEQRLSLKHTGQNLLPHLLVMTATPIPRSLALTLYGDLNLSFLKEKPAGRKAIETHLLKNKSKAQLKERLKKFLEEGRQIYIVYPLVEESEKLDLKNATDAFKEWQEVFGKDTVGLLHGKMKAKEKDAVMNSFKQGELRVLVSTTVIEVGVDVPNASVMVIEHAERFGLSQLHQLRGRVGRGSLESYCVLMGPDNPGDEVFERLKILERSEDGFEIAEKDLEIRGPGEFLGRRQSGLSGFRVAHILRDQKWLEIAREEAREILEKDPSLIQPENRALREGLKRWWLGKLELTLSG